MKVGLKSGYEFFCEDGYYTDTNKLDGETVYTFISTDRMKKYVVNMNDVEFFESMMSDEDIAELAMYGEYEYHEEVDHSIV